MSDLTFVTGNTEKFQIAQKAAEKYGINLLQAKFDIDEIQGEDSELIVRDKANKAYQAAGGPVVVNDDSWSFPGLGGFPGPYMKSILHWLSAEDLLRLTLPLEDRRIILSQWIVYQDSTGQKIFQTDYTGEVLTELRGKIGLAHWQIISMPGDNGLSVAEAYERGAQPGDREVVEGWNKFIEWYKASQDTAKQ